MSHDADKAEKFSAIMANILNYGALNLAMGMGYASGLFEALASFEEPASCAEIAREAAVDERYCYEWLGVMCAGGIVDVTGGPEHERFFLPQEHAPFLCRRGGNANLGVYTQEIPLLTQCAMEGVLRGMRTGEGLPYASYPKFYDFMEQLADAKHRDVLIDGFLPSVLDGDMVRRLEQGCRVCDVGCGGGVALELMAKAFPASEFTGLDIDAASIRKASHRARQQGLANITFLVADAADANLTNTTNSAADVSGSGLAVESFDYILAFDAIHDQTNPAGALRNIHRMLTPGGVFSMIDIAASSAVSQNTTHPMGPFLYTVSLMHCLPVGRMAGGAGLGMMWGKEKAVAMCRAAGFGRVEVLEIPEDGFNYHYLCVK